MTGASMSSSSSAPGGGPQGFTLIEFLIVIVIMGILVTLGLNSIVSSVARARVEAVPEFYIDGLRRAREGAIKYNGAARLALSTSGSNGQFDYQIDWCSPIAGTACSDTIGTWSTTSSPVSATPGQPPGPSIQQSAAGLPPSSLIAPSASNGQTEVYFNSLGWLNTSVANATVANIRWLRFVPTDAQILPTQVSITLSGIAVRCYPTVASTDSRSCPP
jgi:type IV fimbrial biogenesis protein FimT